MSEKQTELKKIKCGIIMPISPIDGCSSDHWAEVKNIFVEATNSISKYDFETYIVSESEDVGIIQKRIVQNIYNSDIVICDVSGKNPNVMFELGMRLAFDKPTIIVKDDNTNYIFDTGVIEHLEYPRDLRFSKIVDFKKRLSSKLIATLEMANKDSEYSTFLKSFGQFKVSKLSEKEVTADKIIINSIEELRRDINRLRIESKIKESIKTTYPRQAVVNARRVINEAFNELDTNSIEEVCINKDLYSEIMEGINASRYFSNEDEFREFYNYIISRY